MPRVTLYTRLGCHLCERASEIIDRVRRQTEFELEVLDIDDDPVLRDRYNEEVPVIAIDGRTLFHGRVDESAFLARLKRSS
jgi:glutaredoxin